MAVINNTPPVLGYLLAMALRISGGGEFWTRALFFPFDVISAWSLLALASRFLKKPLWPVLVVLAGPAWALNLNHVMAERVMAAFALSAVYLAVISADEKKEKLFWGSAMLAALALLTKYNALFVLPPVITYLRSRGTSYHRCLLWCVVAMSGFVLAQAWSFAVGGASFQAAWGATSASAHMSWSAPSHRLRALLAFTGGLGFPCLLWCARVKTYRRDLLLSAVPCAILFLPWFDLVPSVRLLDRCMGFVFSCGVFIAVSVLARSRKSPGSMLWLPWIASVAVLQLAYWSVVARFVVFLLPPLTFGLWEVLESESPGAAPNLGPAAFAVSVLFGLALSSVDRTYAEAQRTVVVQAAARAHARGGTLWTSGHWGLQEYALAAGARQLDVDQGGWEQARPGDVVLVGAVNTNRIPPSRPRLANKDEISVGSPIPLRHMGDWKREGGFYSSGMGFLPWSFSTGPVDSFTIVELL